MTQSARPKRAAPSDKVWATLITNLSYLPGVLTLDHSLRRARSAYPLLALHTDALPAAGLAALAARGIPCRRVDPLAAASPAARDFAASPDPRFADTFTKLAVFSLVEHDRVVLLDSDMLVLRNMDELMDLALDDPALAAAATTTTASSSPSSPSSSRRVFAASHVCACNPLRKPHYPASWTPDNCAFTRQAAADPDRAQRHGADPRRLPVAMINGGLVVLRPSAALHRLVVDKVARDGAAMYFPDQEVLSDLWRDRWAPLPYVYNALKTMRRPGVHADLWRDDQVRVVHYILSPKPWDELDERGDYTGTDETHAWWAAANQRRRAEEKLNGITDGY